MAASDGSGGSAWPGFNTELGRYKSLIATKQPMAQFAFRNRGNTVRVNSDHKVPARLGPHGASHSFLRFLGANFRIFDHVLVLMLHFSGIGDGPPCFRASGF